MLPTKLAFVDIETTGTRSFYDRIIEIGILRVENNALITSYQTLINPEAHIPPEITVLTGITTKDLENAPLFRHIKDDLQKILEDCVFVAHNVRFDYSFLRNEFKREGITFSSKHFCTVKLSKKLYPRFTRHNLDAIIERFQFRCKNRHRAFDDAEILFSFYQRIQNEFPEEKVLDAVNFALKKPSLPVKLQAKTLDDLPELPGVYLFYGENNTPLYIGKSKNIRDRVLSHFSGDLHSSLEMKISQQIERIETIVTAGELGALFTESSLIKKMLPLYNKMLRIKKELVGVRRKINKDGYENVYLETIQEINPAEFDSFVGFFRSRKQAKEFLANMAKEHNLCEKLLDLEKTNAACFGYRLDRCKGACVGEELPIKYNFRFINAFASCKLKPWPFTGPIVIEEKNEFTGLTEYFLVDKWCYLGSIKVDNEEKKNDLLENELQFDLDIYKILKRYLFSKNNLNNVRTLDKTELQEYITSNQHLANVLVV